MISINLPFLCELYCYDFEQNLPDVCNLCKWKKLPLRSDLEWWWFKPTPFRILSIGWWMGVYSQTTGVRDLHPSPGSRSLGPDWYHPSPPPPLLEFQISEMIWSRLMLWFSILYTHYRLVENICWEVDNDLLQGYAKANEEKYIKTFFISILKIPPH